jgi:hypothetical protein
LLYACVDGSIGGPIDHEDGSEINVTRVITNLSRLR